MVAFPNNPFKPGAGRTPAHRGRRPEVESVLSGFLRTLAGGQPDLELGFLYGPRGNGKTVLLNWLEHETTKVLTPGGKRVAQVRIFRAEMDSPLTVAETILNATSDFLGRFSLEANVAVPGLGSIRVADATLSQPLSLAQALSKSADPLLITLDEAHEVSPERLGELLDVVQGAGRHRPIAVVFAGTPGLELALLETQASFWSRGEKLRIGLLEDGSARDVLAQPFRDAGLEVDDEAVADLAIAADNYPYFLQLYGRAAWRVVEMSGGRALRPEHVAPALEAANGGRQDYYRSRYEEFLKAGLLPLARQVAEAFVTSAKVPVDRCLTDDALAGLLTYEGSYEHRMFLIAKGYVWQNSPETQSWTPGIPSLMDYMLARIPDA